MHAPEAGSRPRSHRLGMPSALAPTVAAVLLAVPAVPIVAASFMLQWGSPREYETFVMPWSEALVLAAASSVVSALVAGSVAGLLVRRHPKVAAMLALAIAWPVGIGMLSVAAAATAMDLEIVEFCLDSCESKISNEALSGVAAYLESLEFNVITWPLLIATVLGLFWLAHLRIASGTDLFLANVVGTGTYATLHVASLTMGGGVAFLCLAVGVAAWCRLLVSPEEPGAGGDTRR